MINLSQQPAPATAIQATQPLTDEALMVLIQARAQHALGLLRTRYAPLLKTIIQKMIQIDAETEDLVQEVFLQVWTHAANYDPSKGAAIAWIVTLARRRTIDRLRQRAAYLRFEERFADATGPCETGWTHVQEDVEQKEIAQYLVEALATLPESQRTAIKLAYYEGMSQREVARHVGIPLGTIKTRLELGLVKMARYLARFGDLLHASPFPARA